MISGITLSIAAIITAVHAVPHVARQIAPPTFFCPTVDSANPTSGAPWQAGISVAGGQGLMITESHTVGYTWTVGGDLGIGAGSIIDAGASFGFSVAESVEDAVEEGANLNCPSGAWTCSAKVTPGVIEYSGHLHAEGPDEGCATSTLDSYTNPDVNDGDQFTIQLPRKDDAGNGFSTPEICVCKNLVGWADPGAPTVACPEDCVAPA